ncbi:hypothetical protein RchiOBHm_Chr3g0466981 [Rosa chinensis]|uniref:Uncharacterized protein n=1 Tax=Rosa chinensis TaxID=74649 RepID=A0A2P6RA38_ROSCH|nr:hypothetical protein RchiOBHm_Chr3g0466981 [Rosa chinensis]
MVGVGGFTRRERWGRDTTGEWWLWEATGERRLWIIPTGEWWLWIATGERRLWIAIRERRLWIATGERRLWIIPTGEWWLWDVRSAGCIFSFFLCNFFLFSLPVILFGWRHLTCVHLHNTLFPLLNFECLVSHIHLQAYIISLLLVTEMSSIFLITFLLGRHH